MTLFHTPQHVPHLPQHLSHELRTPLNTTWLGIKLLSDEANEGDDDDRDEDKIEILTSMGTACKVSQQLLGAS